MSRLENSKCKGLPSAPRKHDDVHMDPSYKVFLEHLNEDGKSYVFQMANGDHNLPAFVKYEEDDGVGSGKKSFGERGECSRRRRRTSDKRCQTSNQSVALGNVPHDQFEARGPLVDESYVIFLGLLKSNDHSRILNHDLDVPVVYEEKKERSAAAERFLLERINKSQKQENLPFKQCQPSELPVSEDGRESRDSSDFKKKLMVILNRPYDQTEYEELLKEARDRKPKCKVRQLRNTTKDYKTKEDGLSYFDHHPGNSLPEGSWLERNTREQRI